MELKLASIFSDNMVLQRNKNINIWGTSSKSNMVSIKFNEKVIDTKVINNEWRIILPSMGAGGPYSMEISDGNEYIILNNKIIISSSKVDNPKYVRYAWTNYGEINIFNKIGLPMAPFRTNRNDG